MALNTVSLRSSLSGYLQLFANRRDVSTENLNRHNDMVRKVDAVVEEVATKQQAIVANRTPQRRRQSDTARHAGHGHGVETGIPGTGGLQPRGTTGARRRRRLFTIKAPVEIRDRCAQVQYANGLEIRREYKGLS